jgi:hypothetical protein
MAVGIYGTIRPADVLVDDIDVYYNYTPNRESTNDLIYKLDSSEILGYNTLPEEEQISGSENLLEGLYNMTLPASVFGQLGIYTIYLKPTTFTPTIVDCSVLSSLPSVKGIVDDNAGVLDFLEDYEGDVFLEAHPGWHIRLPANHL